MFLIIARVNVMVIVIIEALILIFILCLIIANHINKKLEDSEDVKIVSRFKTIF